MAIPQSEVYLSLSVSTTEYNLGFELNCTENVKLNQNKQKLKMQNYIAITKGGQGEGKGQLFIYKLL